MESISYYGSDEEQENTNNSKRDNPSTNIYGNYESSSLGHSSSETSSSRRRKVTDDTNYEEIQMDLSEDSDSSENHSVQVKVSDSKPKKSETDFTSQQSSHRTDKHIRLEDKAIRSSSKEEDRYKGDKSKECSGRDKFSAKSRDRKEEKYRNRDKDRERDRDRDRNDRHRDRGRNRPEKDDKFSRHRDSRLDNRRDKIDRHDRHDRHDRNDQRRDRTTSDKDRNRTYEKDRERRSTGSKSKTRSRSRDRSSTTRSQTHDRSAIKEPPKSLMSLQLPQMPLSTTTSTLAKPIEPVAVLPNIISPLLVSARYTEQMQKRKLLWGNKKAEGEPQQTTNNRWEQTKFSQDSDGKMASKFLRLMGMKDGPPKVGDDETNKAPDSIKKQTEMLSSMEQQYEVARQMTHTMRGMGLGFGTQPRHY